MSGSSTDTDEVRLKRLDKAWQLVDSLGKPGEWSYPERVKGFDLIVNLISHLPPKGQPEDPWPDLLLHPRVASVAVATAGVMIENVLIVIKHMDELNKSRGRVLGEQARKKWDNCVAELTQAADLINKQIDDGGFFDPAKSFPQVVEVTGSDAAGLIRKLLDIVGQQGGEKKDA